jgi:polyisoprenoid-binding protein YceI
MLDGHVTHHYGPDNATLTVQTRRGGAAAKAGHDLLLVVTRWEGTLEAGDDGPTAASLTADSTSLRVQRGAGGMMALSDDDKANIHQTIDDEVLKRGDIAFRSTSIEGSRVLGELTIGSTTKPIEFDLNVEGGSVSATIAVTQTKWGMKPYSALFGALKVHDDVVVALQSR